MAEMRILLAPLLIKSNGINIKITAMFLPTLTLKGIPTVCNAGVLFHMQFVKVTGLTRMALGSVTCLDPQDRSCSVISAQIKLVNRRKCLAACGTAAQAVSGAQTQLRSSLPRSQGARAAVCLSLPISHLLGSLWGLLLLV